METKVLSSGVRYSNLPVSYIRPEAERPRLSEVSACENVPVIDLGSQDRGQIVQQLGHACKSYGFFQVTNHGVSMESVEKMLGVAHEFFSLPVEEKMKLYSDDPFKTMRLSTSFNVKKETVHTWRDYLRLHCYPVDNYVPEWPSVPSSFREIVQDYCMQVRELGFRLQELISESLGLDKDYIKSAWGEQGQHMVMNYYPPCPEPELTYGLPGHTEPNALTILLQDLQVADLQVLKEGKWVAVNTEPKAFVIDIGDQLQALSNGLYKSLWHWAIVNADKPRLTVAYFLCPFDEALISPAKKWVANPEPSAFVINIGDQLQALSNGLYKSVWHRTIVNAVNPQPNAFVVNQETVHTLRDYLRVRCWRELFLIPFSFKGGEISFKGRLSNQIKEEQLKAGDHIYSWRRGYLYAHHGIYAGDGKVIHYTKGAGQEIGKARTGLKRKLFSSTTPPHSHVDTNNPCPTCGDHPSKHNGVISSCLDCFLLGGKLYLFVYGVSLVSFVAKARGGTCTIASSDQPDDVLERANYLLRNGFGGYNLLDNNCEDFALYCKTGILVLPSMFNRSGQVASVFGAINAIHHGLTASLCAAINAPSYGLLGCGVYFATRYFSDIGVRRNVIKVRVERLVTCTDDLIHDDFDGII